MKRSQMLLTVAAVAFAAFSSSRLLAADASKEVTLTGDLVCAKCVLHQTTQCQNVLQVVDSGKTNNYYLIQNTVSKDFHPNICTTAGEKVTVTGTFSKSPKDGSEMLKAATIEPVK